MLKASEKEFSARLFIVMKAFIDYCKWSYISVSL